jgi:hypothetical protein
MDATSAAPTRVGEKSSGDGTKRDFQRWLVSARPKRRSIMRDRSVTRERHHAGTTMELIGRRHWAIAEGYIPSQSSFTELALISHETACILNATDTVAHINITIFFTDREPIVPYRVSVAARRTLHLRFNDLKDPAPVPRDTEYASVFESDVPIIVQHTRLDSRHAEVSLLSTMAYAEA